MRVVGIFAELFVYEGGINWKHPTRLRIAFDTGRHLTVHSCCRNDGIRLDNEPLTESDMEEYGRIEIHDMNDFMKLNLNLITSGPRTIRNRQNDLLGLAFPLVDNGFLCIWGNADELWWGSEAELQGTDAWPPGFEASISESLEGFQ